MEPWEQAAERVAASRIYRQVSAELIGRLARQEAAKGRSGKELDKAVKNLLHRDWGAFVGGGVAKAERLYRQGVAALPDAPTRADWQRAVAPALGQHASTAGRIAHLERLGALLAPVARDATSVVDVACGLNPLSLPFWPFERLERYTAWDIDAGAVALVNAFLADYGLPPGAAVTDAVHAMPPPADLALIFQFLPVAERQERGAALRLLSLPARRLAVTLPTASLGGNRRGMAQRNADWMAALLEGSPRTLITRAQVGAEWLYLLE